MKWTRRRSLWQRLAGDGRGAISSRQNHPAAAVAIFTTHRMMTIILIRDRAQGTTPMAAASDHVTIVSAARMPLGRFMGDLSGLNGFNSITETA
jgi:hypothetical protein